MKLSRTVEAVSNSPIPEISSGVITETTENIAADEEEVKHPFLESKMQKDPMQNKRARNECKLKIGICVVAFLFMISVIVNVVFWKRDSGSQDTNTETFHVIPETSLQDSKNFTNTEIDTVDNGENQTGSENPGQNFTQTTKVKEELVFITSTTTYATDIPKQNKNMSHEETGSVSTDLKESATTEIVLVRNGTENIKTIETSEKSKHNTMDVTPVTTSSALARVTKTHKTNDNEVYEEIKNGNFTYIFLPNSLNYTSSKK